MIQEMECEGDKTSRKLEDVTAEKQQGEEHKEKGFSDEERWNKEKLPEEFLSELHKIYTKESNKPQ